MNALLCVVELVNVFMKVIDHMLASLVVGKFSRYRAIYPLCSTACPHYILINFSLLAVCIIMELAYYTCCIFVCCKQQSPTLLLLLNCVHNWLCNW